MKIKQKILAACILPVVLSVVSVGATKGAYAREGRPIKSVLMWGNASQGQAVPGLRQALAPFAGKIKNGVSLEFSSITQMPDGNSANGVSGRIWLKDKLFRIFFSGIDAAYDGQYLRSVDSEQGTYTIAIPSQQDLLLLSPLSLLQNPQAHFTVSPINGKPGEYAYKAVPKGKEFAGVEYFELCVNASSGMPSTLKLKASTQEEILYRVLSVKDRPTLNAYDFTYQARETRGLEFIDLR